MKGRISGPPKKREMNIVNVTTSYFRRFAFIVALIVLLDQGQMIVRAFQSDSSEPIWARRIENQHMNLIDRLATLSDKVDVNTGTFSQRLDNLDQRTTGIATRLTDDESGGTAGARVEIAGLKSTVNEMHWIVTGIFGAVISIIVAGLGLAWFWFRRAAESAQAAKHVADLANQVYIDLEKHQAVLVAERAAVADKLDSHEAVMSAKLEVLRKQGDGMAKHLEELTHAAGVLEGGKEERKRQGTAA